MACWASENQVVQNLALDITMASASSASAIFHYIQANVPLRSDPYNIQVIQDPILTLSKGGNCMQHAILMASLLKAANLPASFVLLLGLNGDSSRNHIYVTSEGVPYDTTDELRSITSWAHREEHII